MSTMPSIQTFRVIKCLSNSFLIENLGEIKSCTARKKVKKQSEILVGDFVSVMHSEDGLTIEAVKERKNFLIRPSVANIDQIVIILATVPQIDFYLVDKLIINAHKQNLDVVICVNKNDLSSQFFDEINAQYSGCADKIISVSALNGEISPLRGVLLGKLSCLAGQSAVGKSSLINALTDKKTQLTGELSEKIARGKNTTTTAEIIPLGQDSYIIDTPGFSMLDVHSLDYSELEKYYPEYAEHSQKCRYRGCSHCHEPDCEIISLVAEGKLNEKRYNRYKTIYTELKSQKKY